MEEGTNAEDVCMSMFKLWSQIDKSAERVLRPDFGYRKWDEISRDDRQKIWSFLWKDWFFDKDGNKLEAFHSDQEYDSSQHRERWNKFNRIMFSLDAMNHNYKANAYARSFLDNRNVSTALEDFHALYLNAQEPVVFELLSFYAKKIIIDHQEGLTKSGDESEEDFKKRDEQYKWNTFDEFAKDLNDVFEHFGVHVFLTRNGFAPRQDEKIINEIYDPVLKILSDEKYSETNEMLKKAFRGFQARNYADTIINSINAIQAYLQMEVHSKTGKGNIKDLIKTASSSNLIPSDEIMVDFYNRIEGYFAQIRMKKTDAHPSYENANESDALLVMNLTMVILQSLVNFKKSK